MYQSVIEADVVTGLEKVIPVSTYVLRPEEARQIAADVASQKKAIDSEKAAAKKAGEQAKIDFKNKNLNAGLLALEAYDAGDLTALDNF